MKTSLVTHFHRPRRYLLSWFWKMGVCDPGTARLVLGEGLLPDVSHGHHWACPTRPSLGMSHMAITGSCILLSLQGSFCYLVSAALEFMIPCLIFLCIEFPGRHQHAWLLLFVQAHKYEFYPLTSSSISSPISQFHKPSDRESICQSTTLGGQRLSVLSKHT